MTAVEPGDVVACRKDLWSHEGIVGPDDRRGVPTVIAASGRLGRVVHQSWEDFSEGQPVKRIGYWGQLPRDVVVDRALSQVGRPYSAPTYNCQHFTRVAHGVQPYSWQARLFGMAAAGLAGWLLAR